MCNKTMCLLGGILLGIVLGYQNEEEIDDFTRQTKKAKRKMLRKMNDMKEHFEM